MSTPYTPRFDILIAQAAPFALIIRHGPRDHACSIGWNLDDDTFTIGQWVNARISPCDLSPDGQHFIYSGYRPWDFKGEDSMERWVAISRTPYVKAIGLWQCGYGGGTGCFVNNSHYQLNIHDPIERIKPDDLTQQRGDETNDRLRHFHHRVTQNPIYQSPPWSFKQTQPKTDLRPQLQVFEKPVGNGHLLRYNDYRGGTPAPNLGTKDGDYQLVDAVNDEIIAGQHWAWADVIDGRLLWLKDACLYATDADRIEFKNARMLYDMRDMQFEPIAAPY